MTSASAPGKLFLCGEHAVVYARPAVAVPLLGIRASATVVAGLPGYGVLFDAPNLGRAWSLADAPDDPLSELAAGLLQRLAPGQAPDLQIALASEIPIASGMGSGAAIATAMVRALAAHYGVALAPAEVSALVYESERRFHGTPSGIDNTVVAFERPVWFVRTQKPDPAAAAGPQPPSSNAALFEPVTIAEPFTLLVGDTGVRSPTRLPVGEVRRRWQAAPARYEVLFDQVGALAQQVRTALGQGQLAALGALLSENHALLRQIGVSSPELDRLVGAAERAGALGAKLSGAGWGGVMFALVGDHAGAPVREALLAAGAVRVLATRVEA